MTNCFKILLVIILFTWCSGLNAKVTLPNLFTNNMVLQREIKIPVWGNGTPGEKITVSLGSNIVATHADENGRWIVKLKPMKAGGPYTLNVTGENVVEFSNVLLGDVWICAGQSNMELPVRRSTGSEKVIANAANPQIRLLTVDHMANADSTRNNVNTEWFECNPNTIGMFSAVGYYFGRTLEKELNVPVGLIDIGWNATRIEAWTSREALKRLESGKNELAAYDSSAPVEDENAMKNYAEKLQEYRDAKTKGITTIDAPERPRPLRRVPSSVA